MIWEWISYKHSPLIAFKTVGYIGRIQEPISVNPVDINRLDAELFDEA